MRTYDVNCPVCGKLNRELYLEETKGWMECDQCQTLSRVPVHFENIRIRIPTGKKENTELAAI